MGEAETRLEIELESERRFHKTVVWTPLGCA